MGVSLQSVTMKSFAILASLLSCCLAAPTATHVASGEPAGPLTLAFGDAVHTPKGLRSYSLEGFSEDLDQDGFVDPIGQAVVVAPVVAPVSAWICSFHWSSFRRRFGSCCCCCSCC